MIPTPAGPAAAVDCGTNSTRLLVVDAEGRTLTRLMRITRLGEGVDATHRLSEDAIERTLDVLAEFRAVMDGYGVEQARMVATSAVRDALNGERMLARASAVVGFPAELLAGDEEGRLAYRGAAADLPPSDGDDVVVDIGGGSTELVAARDGRIEAVSLDLGCVRLTERYLPDDPPRPAQLAAATAAVDRALDRATGALSALGHLRPRSRLLGLAGTVSTLAALDRGVVADDYRSLHHVALSAEAVARWCGVLAAEPARARMARTGMARGREDVIVGGALVLREVMKRFGFEQCTVSQSDILDGLAASVLAGH